MICITAVVFSITGNIFLPENRNTVPADSPGLIICASPSTEHGDIFIGLPENIFEEEDNDEDNQDDENEFGASLFHTQRYTSAQVNSFFRNKFIFNNSRSVPFYILFRSLKIDPVDI
jgi:hypothetical protein